jgi:hypothetical protein
MEKEMEDGRGNVRERQQPFIIFAFSSNGMQQDHYIQHGEEGTRITMIKHGFAIFPIFSLFIDAGNFVP